MPGVVIAAVLSVALPPVLGAIWLVSVGKTADSRGMQPRAQRVTAAVDASTTQVGRIATAVVVALAGFAATILTCWVLGKFAHAMEGAIDRPVFDWFATRQLGGGWQRTWNVLTLIGNRTQTQRLTVAGAVVLTVLWLVKRRARPWIPLVVIPVGYLFEKYGQIILKLVVDRGHPPTTLGTWPSGGCARLLITYGLLLVVALLLFRASKSVWALGGTVLGFFAMVEAYSRTYLQKHWVTDVAGGLIYGILGLAVMTAVVLVLDRERSSATALPLAHPAGSSA